MLFKYGLPSKISDGDTLVIDESKEEEVLRNNRNKYIMKMAYFGLSFILIGFVFQLIGTNIYIFE